MQHFYNASKISLKTTKELLSICCYQQFLTIDKNKIENTFLSSTPIGSLKVDCETTVPLIKPNQKKL